jgi:hypothetical protein
LENFAASCELSIPIDAFIGSLEDIADEDNLQFEDVQHDPN